MKDLTVGDEGKLVVQFTIPMIIGNVLQQSYQIVNSIIVGRFIGESALAAVGASFPIIFLLISLVVGIANGATIIVAQLYGAKNFEKINKAIDTLNIFMFFSAILISFVGIYFAHGIFVLLDLPSDVIPSATLYLQVYLWGLIGLFGFHSASAILRGLGDSKTPLYIQLASIIVNIILDLILIIYFKMGVEGAAIATIVAQGGTFVFTVFYLNKTNNHVRFKLFNLHWNKELFHQSVRIGLPSGLQQSFVALGMMALIWIVDQFGTHVVAAYTVASRIDMFASIPAMTFSYGLSTFVGQNIGAGKWERARTGFHKTLWITSVMSVVMALIIGLFSHSIMTAFSNQTDVIDYGSQYLQIVASFYVLFSLMFVIQGILRGAGDTLVPMFITLFALWGVRIPVSYVLSKHFGVTGIWWGIPTGWIIGMFFAWAWYLKGNWKTKTIISN